MAVGDVSISTFNCEAGGWTIVFDATGGESAAPLKVKDSTLEVYYVRSIQICCGSIARPCIWDGSVGGSATLAKKLTPRIPSIADITNIGTATHLLAWNYNPPIKCGDGSSIVYDCSGQGWFGGVIQGYRGL